MVIEGAVEFSDQIYRKRKMIANQQRIPSVSFAARALEFQHFLFARQNGEI